MVWQALTIAQLTAVLIGRMGQMPRERGQTLAEYSLLLALVAVGVAVPTMIIMRTALAGAFGSATDCILRVTC